MNIPVSRHGHRWHVCRPCSRAQDRIHCLWYIIGQEYGKNIHTHVSEGWQITSFVLSPHMSHQRVQNMRGAQHHCTDAPIMITHKWFCQFQVQYCRLCSNSIFAKCSNSIFSKLLAIPLGCQFRKLEVSFRHENARSFIPRTRTKQRSQGRGWMAYAHLSCDGASIAHKVAAGASPQNSSRESRSGACCASHNKTGQQEMTISLFDQAQDTKTEIEQRRGWSL